MEGMVTLKAACKEALRRGFISIWLPEVGILDNLAELADDLEDGDKAEYMLFGSLIICMTDAWKEDAEVYELSY